MNRQIFIDKILETENLTNNLEDEEANVLLEWGTAQVDDLIKDMTDDDQAGEKANEIMHVMRRLNSIAGNPTKVSKEVIADLVKRYETMIGGEVKVESNECRSVAEHVSRMEPGDIIQYLTDWLQAKKS